MSKAEYTKRLEDISEGRAMRNRACVVFGVVILVLLVVSLPVWLAYNETQNRKASFLNLRQIGLGLSNHEAAYRWLPTSENTRKESPHPYSWRVAILPYIEHTSLYNQYRFDEPWDSDNNKNLMQQMPSVFRHPFAPKDSTTTSVVLLTGTETAFPGDQPVKLADITDGPAKTIFVVESKSSIPWTKPEDLKVAPDTDVTSIGGFYSNCFFAAFGNGEVKCIQHSEGKDKIWAMFTANRGDKAGL